MKFEISNHADELFQAGQVRLTIDTDASSALQVLEAAAKIHSRKAQEAIDTILGKVLGGE